MKKILTFILLFTSILFSQTNFWSHYSLDTPVYELINYGDSVLIAVRDIDILKSTDMGLNWNTIYTSPNPCWAWTRLDLFQKKIITGQLYMIIHQINGSYDCTNVPVKISTNFGQNWNNLSLPNGNFGDIDITSNGTLVYISDTSYYSSNGGISWEYLNIPNDGRLQQKIEIDSDDNLYTVKEHKYWYEPAWIWFRSELLYKSTDFGQNWEFLFNTIYEPNASFATLFHTEYNEIIASQSVPAPKTWYLKEDSLFLFPLRNIFSIVTVGPRFYFASAWANTGVNYSNNFGQTWSSQNTGLTSLDCFSLTKDSLGYLYLGTANGIFRSTSSAYLTTIDIDEGKFENFYISDSYPNPFNPTTTIEYQIPKTSNVKISLFNLVGEEIAVLVNEEKSQGKYKVEFNGANLSSGVYFYKMQAENFTSTKKFVLLK